MTAGEPSRTGVGKGRPRRPAAAPWKVNLRWTTVLLVVWFGSTFCVSWYARELRFDFFGWPFSYWAGGQGLLILYVVMAALYAWRMNRADRAAAAQQAGPAHQGQDRPEAHDGHAGRDRHHAPDRDTAMARRTPPR